MGKNIKGGSKHKKYARQREFIIDINLKNLKKEKYQEYAHVSNVLGNCRFDLICWDGKRRLGCLRGSMRKRTWINKGDIVLVGLRDFQDEKCDIIQLYKPEQVSILVKNNEFSSTFSNDGMVENKSSNRILEENEEFEENFDFNEL
jgi:translation initiation factor 1A